MIEINLPQQLQLSAEKYKKNTALIFPFENLRVSFNELQRKCNLVSKALLSRGYRKGSHIAIWSTNCSRWVYLALGAAQIGAVFVPVNVGYKNKEIMDICLRSDANALFVMDSFRGNSARELLASFFREGKLELDLLPELKEVFWLSDNTAEPFTAWKSFLKEAESVSDQQLEEAKKKVNKEDTYLIQFTSGTTSKPKGARLTQYGCLNTAACYAEKMHLAPGDENCVPLPLFHCFGNVLTLLGGIITGSSTMYIPYFSASKMLKLLEQEHCTCMMGVPTMYSALMMQPDFDADKLSLVKAGIGGAVCPHTLADQISERFHMDHLAIGYGLSEAASLCTLSDINDPAQSRLYSVGNAMPGLEVSLFDTESKKISDKLSVGEIVVRGFSVMTDYYKDPVETAEVLDENGWLHTGDMGYFSPDGHLHITDRIKDIVIRGGENISVSEIEECVDELPCVNQCQCVGVPDPVMGEEITAFIIAKEGQKIDPKIVKDYTIANLAKYKVPKYIFELSEFPLNSSGKVLKTELRKMAKELVKA